MNNFVYFTPKVYRYSIPKVYQINLISKSVRLMGRKTRTGLVPLQHHSQPSPIPLHKFWERHKRMSCPCPSLLSLIELENQVETNHTDGKWLNLSQYQNMNYLKILINRLSYFVV